MKICRFLSVMMVFALVISSVSALADYTVSTTTTYNTASGKVDVQTTVTGLTDGSMTSYLVYEKGADLSTLTGDQIVYIDQNNSSTATTTFEFTMDKSDNYASSVLVGNNVDTLAANDGADLEAFYRIQMSSTFTSNCSAITVTSIGREDYTYTFSNSTDTYNFPVGYDLLVEFTPLDGKVIDSFDYSTTGTADGYEGHDLSAFIVGNKIKIPAATLPQSASDTDKILLRAQDRPSITNPASDVTVSIDSNVLKGQTEADYEGAEGGPQTGMFNSLTYFCTVSTTDSSKVTEAGIDLYVYENASAAEPAYVLEDLKAGAYGDNGAFAIRVLDMLSTDYDADVEGSLQSMFSDGCVYLAIPYYRNADGTKISVRNGTVSTEDTVLN